MVDFSLLSLVYGVSNPEIIGGGGGRLEVFAIVFLDTCLQSREESPGDPCIEIGVIQSATLENR